MEAYSNVSLASKQGLHMRTHTKRIRGDFTSKQGLHMRTHTKRIRGDFTSKHTRLDI
jgi:hypothetical protein